jgi:hypothetical protein
MAFDGTFVRSLTWLLAVVHVIWGAALLAAAASWTVSAIRILPHMSSGTLHTNLPIVAMLAVTFAGPLLLLGLWLVALGRAIWRRDVAARTRVLWTHGVLLAPALLAVLVGIAELRAAERSAAHGGGLLGGIGLIPLVLGGALAALNIAALAAARYLLPSPGI